jgi:hypothetical protein
MKIIIYPYEWNPSEITKQYCIGAEFIKSPASLTRKEKLQLLDEMGIPMDDCVVTWESTKDEPNPYKETSLRQYIEEWK